MSKLILPLLILAKYPERGNGVVRPNLNNKPYDQSNTGIFI